MISQRYITQMEAVNAIPEDQLDSHAYIDVTGEDELVLDGTFTVAQLKSLVTAMESVP